VHVPVLGHAHIQPHSCARVRIVQWEILMMMVVVVDR
jgi:hypothetical protein